jgi:hypothetical protein
MEAKFVIEVLQGLGAMFVLSVVGITGWVVWHIKRTLKE